MIYFKLHSSGGSCVSQATVIEINGNANRQLSLDSRDHPSLKQISVCSQNKCSSFFSSFTIKIPHSSSLFTNYMSCSVPLHSLIYSFRLTSQTRSVQGYIYSMIRSVTAHTISLFAQSLICSHQSLLHMSQCMKVNKNNLFT